MSLTLNDQPTANRRSGLLARDARLLQCIQGATGGGQAGQARSMAWRLKPEQPASSAKGRLLASLLRQPSAATLAPSASHM